MNTAQVPSGGDRPGGGGGAGGLLRPPPPVRPPPPSAHPHAHRRCPATWAPARSLQALATGTNDHDIYLDPLRVPPLSTFTKT